jgi:hypothetical protein
MACQHNNRIGDNYGETCLDCGLVISGYGYWAEGGTRECNHEWQPDGDGNMYCPYCQATTSIKTYES